MSEEQKVKTPSIGDHIIWVDPYGKPRQSLVTDVHESFVDCYGAAGVNLVTISDDVDRHDSYGRQIERETSVVHKSSQPAHGNCWCWPDEL